LLKTGIVQITIVERLKEDMFVKRRLKEFMLVKNGDSPNNYSGEIKRGYVCKKEIKRGYVWR